MPLSAPDGRSASPARCVPAPPTAARAQRRRPPLRMRMRMCPRAVSLGWVSLRSRRASIRQNHCHWSCRWIMVEVWVTAVGLREEAHVVTTRTSTAPCAAALSRRGRQRQSARAARRPRRAASIAPRPTGWARCAGGGWRAAPAATGCVPRARGRTPCRAACGACSCAKARRSVHGAVEESACEPA